MTQLHAFTAFNEKPPCDGDGARKKHIPTDHLQLAPGRREDITRLYIVTGRITTTITMRQDHYSSQKMLAADRPFSFWQCATLAPTIVGIREKNGLSTNFREVDPEAMAEHSLEGMGIEVIYTFNNQEQRQFLSKRSRLLR